MLNLLYLLNFVWWTWITLFKKILSSCFQDSIKGKKRNLRFCSLASIASRIYFISYPICSFDSWFHSVTFASHFPCKPYPQPKLTNRLNRSAYAASFSSASVWFPTSNHPIASSLRSESQADVSLLFTSSVTLQVMENALGLSFPVWDCGRCTHLIRGKRVWIQLLVLPLCCCLALPGLWASVKQK